MIVRSNHAELQALRSLFEGVLADLYETDATPFEVPPLMLIGMAVGLCENDATDDEINEFYDKLLAMTNEFINCHRTDYQPVPDAFKDAWNDASD